MDPQSLFVPPEVLLTIIELLPCGDVRSLRAVCATLNFYCLPYAIRRVYLSTHWKDRENLTQISQHPALSQFVEEIVYDSTNYEDYLTDLDTYKELLTTGAKKSRGSQSSTNSSIIRGHALYQQAYAEQASLREYRGPCMTRPMDDTVRPRHFEAMLCVASCFYQVAEYLPDDLVRLVRALTRMPKVNRITLSDCRWTKHHDHAQVALDWTDICSRPHTYSIYNQGKRGLEAVVVDPRPWPEITENSIPAFDVNWYRGFRVVTQALAMTGNDSVTHLGIERDGTASGLSWTMLQPASHDASIMCRSFRHLKTIDLQIDTTAPRNNGWFTNGNPLHTYLPTALASAAGLEHLTIHFDRQDYDTEGYLTSFAGLIGYNHWSHLQSVSLANIVLLRSDALRFLGRHRRSLKSLTLDRVFLTTSWPNDRERDNSSGWKKVFLWLAAARIIALQSLTVDTDPTYDWTRPRFHACNARDVQRLLESGGDEQPSVPCLHDW
ncbi:MAG: hypothetical protein L6R41_006560 [Letrouitia leprolyta]|nr:MAG: hypothetical protein L6R41_006560 [Letrouitia leprolyta]